MKFLLIGRTASFMMKGEEAERFTAIVEARDGKEAIGHNCDDTGDMKATLPDGSVVGRVFGNPMVCSIQAIPMPAVPYSITRDGESFMGNRLMCANGIKAYPIGWLVFWDSGQNRFDYVPAYTEALMEGEGVARCWPDEDSAKMDCWRRNRLLMERAKMKAAVGA